MLSFTSVFASCTPKGSSENENDDKNDSDDKQPSNNDSVNNNDKKRNRKKNDKSSTATPPSRADFSTLFCIFVFDTDPTRPLLAERLNSGYDISFDPAVLFESACNLPNNSCMVLRDKIWHILIGQAEVKGPSTDAMYMSSSRQLIIKTITDFFSFESDMGRTNGLIKTTRSLQNSVSLAM